MLSLQTQSFGRLLTYGVALFILSGSLLYSNYLASQLAEKEQLTMELKAKAIDLTGNAGTGPGEEAKFAQEAQTFIFDIIKADNKIPWIMTDEEDTFLDGANLGLDAISGDAFNVRVGELIKDFKAVRPGIRVEYTTGQVLYIYFGESQLLQQLKWFPVIQLLVAGVFIAMVMIGFAAAKRSEQNRVWVGLAKETAHQLGTPVSSLMAWTELLRLNLEDQPENHGMILEMEQDVKRLEDIAERFSKIGSKPELLDMRLHDLLERSAKYLEKRMTRSGNIKLHLNNHLAKEETISVNPQLFNWVIENLLKNALDALQDKRGSIVITAMEQADRVFIDVTDTGKGIPRTHFKKVFEPGFTTKKRGWGLGLSLTKRIVENYHKGKIYVKASEQGKGTTFRVELPKRKG
ncbi:MAG: HAMP domain-containing sensor histidine kinase [Bacteroidota bacterium]